METYKTEVLTKLDGLKKILEKGVEFGFDFSELYEKINSVKESLGDDRIRIVLLSSFSDGKTSTIAGLLGKIEDNMKIDNDESSDEIVVYHPDGFAKGFEIVDTPGLFGTKEKEVSGRCIRFSEITEKYLSEANLIIYICDAVTPLKDSHAPIIEQLMRKFHKLDSTIFVINKMDEAGFDLSDETDFIRGSKIKKENLIQRLKDTIHLTPEEEQKLKLVCISADPGGEGLKNWFDSMDEYKEYSHIGDLQKQIDEVITNSDKRHLQIETANASLIEVTNNVTSSIRVLAQRYNESIDKANELTYDMSQDLDLLKKDLNQNKKEMSTRLNELINRLLAELDAASVETINEVLQNEIGIVDGEINFYILNRSINQIVSECSEANDVSINTNVENIGKQASAQDEIFKDLAKGTSDALQKVKISGETVKSVRNIIAKDYKFHPWGAIKLGAKASKALNYAGKGLTLALSAYSFVKDYRANDDLNKMKGQLKNEVNKIRQDIFSAIDDNDEYYKKFAPSFIELGEQINKRKEDLNKLREKNDALCGYGHILTQWTKDNAKECRIVDEQ